VVGKFDNDFFPDRASLFIVDVMHLVEDDPFDISDSGRVVVEHLLEDLGRHDQARGIIVQLNVACQHANVSKLELEVTVLLVRK
jgi:hypothetical protein